MFSVNDIQDAYPFYFLLHATDALKGTLKRELAKPSTDKAIANLRKGMTARVEKRIQLTLEQSVSVFDLNSFK